VCPRVVILFESDASTDEEGWSLAGKHQTVMQIGSWTHVQEPKKVRSCIESSSCAEHIDLIPYRYSTHSKSLVPMNNLSLL
jgi:hypothetical protein